MLHVVRRRRRLPEALAIAILVVVGMSTLASPALASGTPSASPSSLSFTAAVNFSQDQMATLTNTGGSALTVQGVSVTTDFFGFNGYFTARAPSTPILHDANTPWQAPPPNPLPCDGSGFWVRDGVGPSFDSWHWFIDTSTPLSLAPGASCAVAVRFAPTSTGAQQRQLQFATDAGTASVSLSGNGINPPQLTITPTDGLFYGQPPVGCQSSTPQNGLPACTQTATITNTASIPLALTAFTNDRHFEIRSNTCTGQLQPNTSCTIGVLWYDEFMIEGTTPIKVNDATLTITDELGRRQTRELRATGWPFGPAIASLVPSTFDFGNVALNGLSGLNAFTFQNVGGSPLTITNEFLTGGFFEDNFGNRSGDFQENYIGDGGPPGYVVTDNLGHVTPYRTCHGNLTLGPGETCYGFFRFIPKSSGQRSRDWVVEHTAGNSLKVTISGTGVAPTGTFDTGTLAFGDQLVNTAQTQTATFTNISQGPLTITKTELVNPVFQGNGGFSFNGCASGTLAAGASCTVTVTFTPTDTGQRTRWITITSDAGNSPQTLTLTGNGVRDTTPPTTDALLTGASGDNGWYRSGVTIALTASDEAGGSGVKNITYAATGAQTIASTTVAGATANTAITANGQTSFTYSARDNANNVEPTQTIALKIDKDAPTTTATPACTSGANGWYRSPVTVALASADNAAGSGVSTLTYGASGAESIATTTVNGSTASASIATDGATTLTYSALDAAGNGEATRSLGVKVDTVAPGTSFQLAGTAGNNGWYRSNVTVTLKATDLTSGVASISVRGAGADPTATQTFTADTATISFQTEGTNTLTYFATDVAGNIESTNTLTVRIDKTDPVKTCASPDGAWHANDVSLACTASDATSGLADTNDASFALTTSVAAGSETNNASTNSRTVCDVAGNCVTAGPIAGNKVDKKAPDITLSTPPSASPYVVGATINASYSCTDGGSGVALCTGTVPSGSAIDTATVGSKVFRVDATDNVGNASSSTVGYAVTYRICALYDQTAVRKLGSAVPIKLQLCNASGANVSSASIVVTARSVTLTTTQVSGAPSDTGNANPDSNFRYDSSLTGYIYNLSTKPLTAGTWTLTFTVAGDPIAHTVQFQVQ